MPESEEHSNLVAILHSYISDRFCEGRGERVLTDSIGSESPNRPPPIEGYVPDAYAMLDQHGRVVIREAKSMDDLENSHTVAQVTAFVRRCEMAEGSVFILAVPWPIERLARILLAKYFFRERMPQVETVVLSEMGGLGAKNAARRSTHCKS